MSINVTVSGNPISIKRGKMVTSDLNNQKSEFDRRRLLRLEQVRQQSKEVAGHIRNKVRKEKKKQLEDIEREGKEKMSNWQNRKLLELQTQYKSALDEIGFGHKAAESLLEEEEAVIEEKQQKREKDVNDRGKQAANKLQIQKNEENYRKAIPLQQKQLARDIENTRAALVANINKHRPHGVVKKKKGRPAASIDITIPEISNENEQDTDSDVCHCENSDEFCSCSESSEKTSSEKLTGQQRYQGVQDDIATTENVLTSSDRSYVPRADVQNNITSNNLPIPLDNRVSQKIKQRKLMALEPDFCDFNNKVSANVEPAQTNIPRQFRDDSSKFGKECHCCKACSCQDNDNIVGQKETENTFVRKQDLKTAPRNQQREIFSDIPYKPAVKLKGVNASKTRDAFSIAEPIVIEDDSENPLEKTKCHCCRACSCQDNVNIAGQKKQDLRTQQRNKQQESLSDIPSKPPVQLNENFRKARNAVDVRKAHYGSDLKSASQLAKISPDSIEVIPNIASEEEWHEKMKQRDQEAEIRGKKALKKEKIQRSYEEMMKQLPILKKKENIAHIGTDKPEYHMSQERYQNQDKQRQVHLENGYARVPGLKPKHVTLPRQKHDLLSSNEPFQILEGDDARTLNLGKWNEDTEPKTMFSTEEVQEIIRAFTVQTPEDRRTKLKNLLKSLKLQKEELLKEIRALPRDDSINALIGDLDSFSEEDKKMKTNKSTKIDKDSKENHHSKDRRSRKKSSQNRSQKTRRDVLVLQNISTQTTPKTKVPKDDFTSTSTSNTEMSKKNDSPKEILKESNKLCTRPHTPCDCSIGKTDSPGELCKIFIKLNDEKPNIEVISSQLDGKELLRKEVVQEKVTTQKTEEEEKKTEPAKKSPKDKRSPVKEKPAPKPSASNRAATALGDRERKEVKSKEPRESWKEHLSKNSVSTSSTSYLSLPDFSRPNTTASTEMSQRSLLTNRHYPSPLQSNVDMNQEKLLRYIKKLLSLSKISVQELGVSSSDVQTPNQSVVETDLNNPLAALHNIVRLINVKASDLQKEANNIKKDIVTPQFILSGEPEFSTIPGDGQGTENVLSQYADITDSCCKRISNLAAMINKLREEKIEILRDSPMVDANLDQKTSLSDKENSTRYLDLPSKDKSKGSSSSASIDEEEFNRRLLDIDLSLAEKLKLFHHGKGDKSSEKDTTDKIGTTPAVAQHQLPFGDSTDEPDYDFMARLQRLIQENYNTDQPCFTQLQPPALTQPSSENNVPFIPFLIDIPKLPILEPEPQQTNSDKKYPPPSKGLITAKKFNDDISLLPHELSTIAEADSQMSTRVSPSTSKTITATRISSQERPKKHVSLNIEPITSPRTDYGSGIEKTPDIEPISKSPTSPEQRASNIETAPSLRTNYRSATTKTLVIPNTPALAPECSDAIKFKSLEHSDPSKTASCNDLTCTSTCLSSSSSRKVSNSSSEMETIEAMLRSIGMDWAIPTLHKTQDALALSSSSSSTSLDATKKRRFASTSTSEVCLKSFLKSQLLSKTSSSLKSDASPSSYTQEFLDISAIVPHSSSVEKSKRRTSTPVLSSKSTSKSKEESRPAFTGTSDISSVRNTSCDNTTCPKLKGIDKFASLGNDEFSVTKSPV